MTRVCRSNCSCSLSTRPDRAARRVHFPVSIILAALGNIARLCWIFGASILEAYEQRTQTKRDCARHIADGAGKGDRQYEASQADRGPHRQGDQIAVGYGQIVAEHRRVDRNPRGSEEARIGPGAD